MKKLAAFLCAVVAVVAGVAYTPAFSASAVEVTLTPEQTRALFSDKIYAEYYDGTDYQNVLFTFYDYGTISGITYVENPGYTPTGKRCVLYSVDTATTNIVNPNDSSYTGNFSCNPRPIFDIQGLNTFVMSCGLSYAISNSDNSYGCYFPNYSAMWNSKYSVYSDYRNTDTEPVIVENYLQYYNYYGSLYARSCGVRTDSDDDLISCTLYTCSLSNGNKYFEVSSNITSNDGLVQYARVSPPNGNFTNVHAANSVFLFIECPTLTNDYIAGNPPVWDSSGGGSESSGGGYDGPDYTDQLALILAKLDLIINNDFNFDVDLSADVSGLESRLDGVNSRLDVNNSRLDGVTGRLDGANSRLDGVNSRLDNISAELHDLNSAPTETLPNTGGENSEFERQAEMYMSDFRNEFEDSENQALQVIDKGTGFLGFVREILITSHLAQILPLLALLFIAHYVIFERGG